MLFDQCVSRSDGFSVMMAAHSLIKIEERIIKAEWESIKGQKDRFTNLNEERVEYAEMRQALESLGKFAAYEEAKKSHNECARSNLDDSNGLLFCYVLPIFNPDGSHEPWGERDVPWDQNG